MGTLTPVDHIKSNTARFCYDHLQGADLSSQSSWSRKRTKPSGHHNPSFWIPSSDSPFPPVYSLNGTPTRTTPLKLSCSPGSSVGTMCRVDGSARWKRLALEWSRYRWMTTVSWHLLQLPKGSKTDLESLGRIPPNSLPQIMSELKLHSVMIEGGSKILSSFLRAPPREDGSPLVDNVIVTVSPMFIGDGIGVVPDVSALFPPEIPADTSQEDRDSLPTLKTSYTEAMGKDAVMVCTLARK